jgi:hypothetical protein
MINKKTEINYSNEASYYMAQQILMNLLMAGKISQEEYIKIDKKNRETFNPFLSRIMP